MEKSPVVAAVDFRYMLGDAMQGWGNQTARMTQAMLLPFTKLPYVDVFSATAEAIAGATLVRGKPDFNITQTVIGGETVAVTEEVVLEKPFCKLVHFKCDSPVKRPSLMLFAPLSGHYATLLRGTVEGLLPDFDVTITDWANARDVPVSAGRFGLDTFMHYANDFIEARKPQSIVAICQPCPAVAGVLAYREENHLYNPRVATFMGGPIDTRVAPTAVTKLAEEKPLEWFDKNMLQQVPTYYVGGGRMVYPGRTQLMSFMAMNAPAHQKKYQALIRGIMGKDSTAIAMHNGFYNEYLSVLDLPGEFYLDTVRTVFQEQALSKGQLEFQGQKIDLGRITETAMLVVEGAHDDISAPGQCLALLDLCPHLPATRKDYLLVEKAGHYGIFNGSQFLSKVVPKITSFAYAHLHHRHAPNPAQARRQSVLAG